ncbi:hypothetical protein ASPWEDRAFT_170474 [Aspergillus wentii DTO 134E9]|uniref:Carbohydrate kinase PfkB domain-containing protein n=1 Tax=Aspergillus wentii DTO 134E9 TaxID=1073089 RepID=A0A1L9RPU4_ASPWE|nr:uncharacterized protein ASPWEDRAFT_170474 [Aspergillus wentii DTO 134E9]KAI9923893.1 hypothetical protein MW887_008198 [Aspergillus wentii]OJJ36975.1 hypothetical protein ASPWEDRAFT_170474 [Aspergillus wentii DTO 134E9]
MPADILAIGSCVLDISCIHIPDDELKPAQGSSNPATITQCVGGVAYNMALAARRAGASVTLSTVIVDDHNGSFILKDLKEEGLSTEGVLKLDATDGNTGTYIGNYDVEKNLIFGMADVSIMQHHALHYRRHWEALMESTAPKWVLLDLYYPAIVTAIIIDCARHVNAKVLIEPVSVPLAKQFMKPFPGLITLESTYPQHNIDLITPNQVELEGLYNAAEENGLFKPTEYKVMLDTLKQSVSHNLIYSRLPRAIQQSIALLQYLPTILTTLDKNGCLLATIVRNGTSPAAVSLHHFYPRTVVGEEDVVSVNGAGDTFNGALIAKLVRSQSHGGIDEDSIQFAQDAAALTVQSTDTVSPDIRMLNYH